MNFHKIAILSIIRETVDTTSFTIALPDDLKRNFAYTAGQYVPLKFIINGDEVTRYYSFSSSPFESVLKFTVKRVENGIVSNFVNDEMTLDAHVEIGEPAGEFVLRNQESDQSYMFIAGGSGITPIFSMINQELRTDSTSKFVLVYVNRSKEQIIFLDELQELQRQYPDRLFLELYVKEGVYEWANEGRLTQEDLESYMNDKYSRFEFDSFYVCGSQRLNDFAFESLMSMNVEKRNIFFELFFVDTEDQNSTNGSAPVEVFILSQDKKVTLNGQDNLLEELLSNGIEIEHSCKAGLCKSCICQIAEGETEIIENFILSDEEIAENYRLLCLTKSKSENLIINFAE